MTQPDDRPIRWGILATGGIAHAFAQDLALQPGCEVAAVGSRSRASADAFGDEFGVPHRHATYQALVSDPDVDAVYVSTPHPGHHDAALLAISAGKAVLVEKPFAMDAAQAREMIDAARGQGTFLMEAMWTRFLPHIARVREILAAGTPGDVACLTAEHGQWFAPDPQFRLFAPELGGGALLDLGIYPVSFASLVPGVPARITAVSHPAFTGVDATTSMIFQYDSGAHAVLTTTLLAASGNPAAIYGTAARIEIDGWSCTPTAFRVIARDGTELERFEEPYEGRGLRGEAAEAGRCLRAGLLESPLLPLDETYTIMQANGRGPPADRLVLPASLIAPSREVHDLPAVPGPQHVPRSALRRPACHDTWLPWRERPAPGRTPSRSRSGTKTANFVTERHLGFRCRHAISADLRGDAGCGWHLPGRARLDVMPSMKTVDPP